uniref:Uncharacterized protein isoform X1 n=1 Tax=Pogona vitticeps TaxID=103695 RepID=A0ABM5F1I9_9SAUR
MSQTYSVEAEPRPEPGDMVEFLRPCFIHYAIAIDKEHVVHLTKGSPHNCSSDTDPTAEVKIERLSVVAGKCKYRINNKYDKRYEPRPPKDIVRIAKAKVGQKGRHSLFRNDCEEFATRMRYGVPITGQVEEEPDGGVQVGQEEKYNLFKDSCEDFVPSLCYGSPGHEQVEAKPRPEPGDMVVFPRSFYMHYAIAVDKEHVVHLTSAAPEGSPHNCSSDTDPTAEVKIERLSVVAGKCKYRINNKYDKRYEPRPPKDIVRIAKAKAGQKGRHSLFRNDCEEFATRMRYGVPITGQQVAEEPDGGIQVGQEEKYNLFKDSCEDFAPSLCYGSPGHEQAEAETRPEPGDMVEFPRSFYMHYAIAVDKEHVVHLTSVDSGDLYFNSASLTGQIAEVKKERLSVVAANCKYQINNKYDSKHLPRCPAEIVYRAKAQVGQRRIYNLLMDNCEHFATSLRYGIALSEQASKLLGSVTFSPALTGPSQPSSVKRANE